MIRMPRFGAGAFDRNVVLVERVKSLASKKGLTASQLALAWVLAKGDDLVPIPGTKRRKYLEENAAAANVRLTAAEVTELEAAAAGVTGGRYSEASMKTIDQ
ncbi:MAG: aldo/keto reductase [Gemmataceae bacterium]